MAQSDHPEDIKQRVQSVREVITGRNKQDIHLVLEHYAYDVERTIQAFLDDGAKEALDQWQFSGSKPVPKKKKKNKKQTKDPDPPVTSAQESRDSAPLLNGDISSESIPERVSHTHKQSAQSHQPHTSSQPASQASLSSASQPLKQRPKDSSKHSHPDTHNQTTAHSSGQPSTQSSNTQQQQQQHKFSYKHKVPPPEVSAADTRTDGKDGQKGQAKKAAEKSTTGPSHASTENIRPKTLEGAVRPHDKNDVIGEVDIEAIRSAAHHKGLEKAQKDLKRQISSLVRLHSIYLENFNKEQKNMSKFFDEARNKLQDREVEIMIDMDRRKEEMVNILTGRQRTADGLKARADRVNSLSDSECLELRADIKHFVSDRKVDEDLANSKNYECDQDAFMQQLLSLGEVPPVACNYTTRRPSISSLSLSSSIGGSSSLFSPPMTPTPSSSFNSSVSNSLAQYCSPPTPNAVRINPPPSLHNLSGAKVLAQSESLTKFENTEMATIISKAREQSKSRRSTTPSGRARSAGRGPKSNKPKQPQGDNKDTSNPGTNTNASPEENRKSRTARRRQKQKERQKEENNSRKTSIASIDAPVADQPKDAPKAAQIENGPAKQNAKPGSKLGADKDGSAKSGGRSSSTKRPQQNRGGQNEAKSGEGKQPTSKVNDTNGPSRDVSGAKTQSPRSGRGRGRGQGRRGRGDDRPQSDASASETVSNGDVGNTNVNKNQVPEQHSAASKATSSTNKENINLENTKTDEKVKTVEQVANVVNNNSEDPKVHLNVNANKDAKSTSSNTHLVRDEFSYDSNKTSGSKNDLKVEANNNSKLLNGDANGLLDNHSHKSLPNGDVTAKNLDLKQTTNAKDTKDIMDMNGSNNCNNNGDLHDEEANPLPQRKPRPNRAALRKPLKSDVTMGDHENVSMVNGNVSQEVEQHRWSNEEE